MQLIKAPSATLGLLVSLLGLASLKPPAAASHQYPGPSYDTEMLMPAAQAHSPCVLTIKSMNATNSYSAALATNSYLSNYVAR